jgi:PAS domain S-box-containing protein
MADDKGPPSPAHETDAGQRGPASQPSHELADAIPFIVWVHEATGVATYFNRAWTEYTGLDLARTLEAGAESVVHPDDRAAVRASFAQAREDGNAFESTYRLRRREGGYRWHLARVVPLRAAEGRVAAWVGTANDIEEERQRDEEQRYLIEATNVLGTSLDVRATLSDVARLVVPHLADWCAIDLAGEDGLLERAAVAHVDPAKVDLAWQLWKLMPPKPSDPGGAYGVMRTQQAEHFEEIPDELIAAAIADPDQLALIRSLGLCSSMCVPLVARGRALGALSLVAAESGRHYTARDLAFASELARRIALAVDNARLYTEATQARVAAEAMAAELLEQSTSVQAALLAMRAERDAALAARAPDQEPA